MPLTACQACGSSDLDRFFEVSSIPVHSCKMVDSREAALAFPTGDLGLDHCRGCGFIQNSLYEPQLQKYDTSYEETQGFSKRFQAFQTELCEDQVKRFDLRGKTALEIGCGKGEFLVELCRIGDMKGIGIDPSYRPERTAAEDAARTEFIQDLYSQEYTHLTADYVCCRHTLEHIGPVHKFVEMVAGTLRDKPDTKIMFELPDVERVLTERAFWDMYYEHCTYFTLGSLARLFRRCGLDLLDLYKVYDGQYLIIEAQPGDGTGGGPFDGESDLEKTATQVEEFRTSIQDKLSGLRGDLARWKSEGRKPVVWGSGSKAVSYLTTLGLRSGAEDDTIAGVVDINPHKWGKFLAGSGHEIIAPESLKEIRPDVVVVMNPIYCDEIRADLNAMGLDPEIVPMN